MNKTDNIIKVCMNEEELVEALYSDEDMIYAEASLGKKIANIKNTGKIAWGVLIGGIIVAVTAIVSSKKLSKGKTVLMVSSEMPELLGVCDRILVMSGGRLSGEVDAKTATQEEIMALAAKYV